MTEYVKCSQLGGINVAYRQKLSKPENPTLIMLHSFCMAKELYDAQFDDPKFAGAFNLLAIDEIGHGSTTGSADKFTFWIHAETILEVMEKLGISKAYVAGTSQGGFIAARMALLQPAKVQGLILAGTSLYSETTDHGSWDASAAADGFLPLTVSDVSTPDWVLPQPVSEMIVGIGLGAAGTEEVKAKWLKIHHGCYKGDEGRKKFAMNVTTLRDRDNLSAEQLAEIKCPVLVAHGTADTVYTIPLAKAWMKDLVNASPLDLEVIEGGSHYLSGSNPKEFNAAVLNFFEKIHSK